MANFKNNNAKAPVDGKKDKGAFTFRSNNPNDDYANWGNIDASLLRSTVQSITTAGAALIVGVTSDGGAYSVCVLDKAQKVKEYPHGTEECEALLRALMEYYSDL